MRVVILLCNLFLSVEAFLKFGDEFYRHKSSKRGVDIRDFDERNQEHFRVSYDARPFRKFHSIRYNKN